MDDYNHGSGGFCLIAIFPLSAHPPPDWKIAAADKPVAGVDDAQHMENVATDFALEMFSLLAQYLSDILRLCDWRNPLLTPVSAGLQVRH